MLITFFFTCAMVFALLALAFPSARGMQFAAIGTASVAAVLAAARSVGEDRYLWFSGFVAIALLLNPIGAMWLTRIPILAVVGVSLTTIGSWMILRRHPRRRGSLAPVPSSRDAR